MMKNRKYPRGGAASAPPMEPPAPSPRAHFPAAALPLTLLGLLLVAAACSNGGSLAADGQTAPPEVISDFSIAPNPAGTKAGVFYALHRDVSAVRLAIYDAAGDFVRRYDDLPARATAGVVEAGAWDLKDFEGRTAHAGSYVARLSVEAGESSWKLTRTVVVP